MYDLVKVVCVYKTGGDYTAEYVRRLRDQVAENISFPYQFVCYSDDPRVVGRVPLRLGLAGWWSKLEVFRETGPVLYLDLDTVILRDITDTVARIVRFPGLVPFAMLQAFKKGEQWASGIMAWHGDFGKIAEPPGNLYGWDQHHIVKVLREQYGITPNFINRSQYGIVSYKHHCRGPEGPPASARIVCFHGKPRPHEVGGRWWPSV
jgi:hypothetical protein